MPSILPLYREVTRLPLGDRIFSFAFARKAPYFATIRPRFTVLEPNHVELVVTKRRAVHNHIGTVHAIALCNGLEAAMGALAEATIPPHKRWIPKGMEVAYPAKADSDVTCVAETDPSQWNGDDPDLPVRVRGTRADGTVVIEGVIRLWVTERAASSESDTSTPVDARSIVTTPSIVRTLTRGTTYAVRHPARSALNAVGLARGTVAAGLSLVCGASADRGETFDPVAMPEQRVDSPQARTEPERVAAEPGERHAAEVAEHVQVEEPALPGEAFAHEATASARGARVADDERVDAWHEDAEDAEHGEPLTAAEGIAQVAEASDVETEAPLPDEPLLDPSVAKSVASEAETMRRAAE